MFWGILAIVLALWYFGKPIKLSSLPGPKGWPLLGNIAQVDMKKPQVTTAEWAKQYGNIFKLTIGGKAAVIVTGTKELTEMFVEKGPDFANRQHAFRTDMVSFKSNVVFAQYSDKWKMMRKTLYHGLKQHNLKQIESITLNVISDCVSDVDALKGSPVNPQYLIQDTFIQILYVLIFGSFVDKQDQEVTMLKNLVSEGLIEENSFIGKGVILDAFPFLRHFGNESFSRLKNACNMMKALDKTWRAKVANGDMQDCWYKELIQNQKTSSLTDDNIMMLTLDFFLAGLLTSNYTTLTILNLLALNPDIQDRMHEEIDKVAGQDRQISLADRENMPYIRACIFETLRYHTVAPVGVPHVTTKDTTLGKYAIPKDTLVITNLWAQHHDPDIWEEPLAFKPERFLTKDGQLVLAGESPRKDLFPFGGGPRICAGETLAQTRLFLFIANIVQKFTILPETTLAKQQPMHPIDDFITGLAQIPKDYKVRMIPRG